MMPHLHEPSTKILYLVPTKTLAKQKQEELSEMLDAIDFECEQALAMQCPKSRKAGH